MFVEMVVSACYAFARILSLEDTVTLIIIIIAPKTRWLSKPQHSILFRVLSVSVVLFTVDESYIHTESEPTRHNSILPIPHFKDFHFGVWRLRKNGVNGSFAAVGGSVFSIKAADEDPIVRFHRSGLWLIPIGPKHDTFFMVFWTPFCLVWWYFVPWSCSWSSSFTW